MLTLPKEVLMDLYEAVFYELLELRELYTASEMLTKCDVLVQMKTERKEKYAFALSLLTPLRYLQMEYWLKKPSFDPIEAYPVGETKETRRQRLASTLTSYITVAPPSRLLTLLQQALAFEKSNGTLFEGDRLNLFQNRAETLLLDDEIPTIRGPAVHFPHGTYPEVVCVSPNGQFVVSGSFDGLIEVWDLDEGGLKLDLPYQKQVFLYSPR